MNFYNSRLLSPDGTAGANGETTAATTTAAAEDVKPNFSSDQQKWIDKFVVDTKHKADKEIEERIAARIKEAIDKKVAEINEAERLNKLNEKDRATEELRLAREQLDAYQKREFNSQIKLMLAEKKLPAEFADHMGIADAEKAKKAIDWFSGYKSELEKSYQTQIDDLSTKLHNADLRNPAPTAFKPADGVTDPFIQGFKNAK